MLRQLLSRPRVLQNAVRARHYAQQAGQQGQAHATAATGAVGTSETKQTLLIGGGVGLLAAVYLMSPPSHERRVVRPAHPVHKESAPAAASTPVAEVAPAAAEVHEEEPQFDIKVTEAIPIEDEPAVVHHTPAAASEKVELLLVVSNPGDDEGTPESVERRVVTLDAEDEPQHSIIVVAEEDE